MRFLFFIVTLLFFCQSVWADWILPYNSQSVDGCFYANPVSRAGQIEGFAGASAVVLQCSASWCVSSSCTQAGIKVVGSMPGTAASASVEVSGPAADRDAVWAAHQKPNRTLLVARQEQGRQNHRRAALRSADRVELSSQGYAGISPAELYSVSLRGYGLSRLRPLGSALLWSSAADAELRWLPPLSTPVSRSDPAPLIVRRAEGSLLAASHVWGLEVGRGYRAPADQILDGGGFVVQPIQGLYLRGSAGLLPSPWDLGVRVDAAAAAWEAEWRKTFSDESDFSVRAVVEQSWLGLLQAPLRLLVGSTSSITLAGGELSLDAEARGRSGIWHNGALKGVLLEELNARVSVRQPWGSIYADYDWWREIHSSVDLAATGSNPALIPLPVDQTGDIVVQSSIGSWLRLSDNWRTDNRLAMERSSEGDLSLSGEAGISRLGVLRPSDRAELRVRGRYGLPLQLWEIGLVQGWQVAETFYLRPEAWIGWRQLPWLQSGWSTWQRWSCGLSWSPLNTLAVDAQVELDTGSFAEIAATLWAGISWRIL